MNILLNYAMVLQIVEFICIIHSAAIEKSMSSEKVTNINITATKLSVKI